MTVNRRTKKASNRQPAAPKAQSQPSKAVEAKTEEAQIVAVEAVAPSDVKASDVKASDVKATANPASDHSKPTSAPVVTEVSTSAATAQSTTQSTIEGSHAMSQEEAVKVEPKPAKAKAAKGAIVPQAPSLSIWDRPIMADQFEVVGTLQMAGVRPVAASELTVFSTYLNGRPIEATRLKLYDELPGSSPIFFSDFHAVEGLDLPGGRPVMASAAGLMAATKLTGDRPIFSNDIDDAYELMGFID
jgi:hypothetical protein